MSILKNIATAREAFMGQILPNVLKINNWPWYKFPIEVCQCETTSYYKPQDSGKAGLCHVALKDPTKNKSLL